jgi:hypothetical protein
MTPGRIRQLAREGRLIPAKVEASGCRWFDRATVEAFARQRAEAALQPQHAPLFGGTGE